MKADLNITTFPEETERRKAEVVAWLRSQANPDFRDGKARFGIKCRSVLGIRIPLLRDKAKKMGKDHLLALALYRTGIHEARILSSMIAEAKRFTAADMDGWVDDFDSWEVCDQCCINLFRYCTFAYGKVREYALQERLFTRRAGFALLATLASGDKKSPDERFEDFFPLIEHYASDDDRDAIKKVVNWALRQIGKRNAALYHRASVLAERLAAAPSSTARWIGKDAVREFGLERVRIRIGVEPKKL